MKYDYEGIHRGASVRTGLAIFFAAALWFQSPAGFAAPTQIPGQPTTLQSNSEFMIAFRHGEHMWQTSDGAIHVLVNRGSEVRAGTSLRLFSSFDSGASWGPTMLLRNTGRFSTADGVLSGDELSVAYTSIMNEVLFSVLRYYPGLQRWSLVGTETAFASIASKALNPAIVIDDQGAVWCAFVNSHNVTGETNIKLVERSSDGSGWYDTGLLFGPTDNIPNDRSARPVLITDGIGMVYTAHAGTYWAYRLNGWSISAPWIEESLFTASPLDNPSLFRSHFNVVADADGTVHLALTDSGRLVYFRYHSSLQVWSRPRFLTAQVAAVYPQITLAPATLNILVNIQRNVAVLQSTDAGDTFKLTYLLTNNQPPDPASGPKMEAPAVSFDPVPVLQQYVENGIQKLLYFEVPAVPPANQE